MMLMAEATDTREDLLVLPPVVRPDAPDFAHFQTSSVFFELIEGEAHAFDKGLGRSVFSDPVVEDTKGPEIVTLPHLVQAYT